MKHSIRFAFFCGMLVATVAAVRPRVSSVRVEQAADTLPTATDAFVDLGAYKLHVVTAGRGKPVVVFESGMGDGASTWMKVQPAIAQIASTVAYDRPGLGTSQSAPEPHDLKQAAAELHALLHKRGSPPPYVLVGHSLGGQIVRVFAFTYPHETAGLVLVDPAEEAFSDRYRATATEEQWQAFQQMQMNHGNNPGMLSDMRAMSSEAQAAAAEPLPGVPKILVSTSVLDSAPAAMVPLLTVNIALHREWVQRTSNAELVMAPTSKHYIHVATPDVVIDAIRKVIAEVASRHTASQRAASGR